MGKMLGLPYFFWDYLYLNGKKISLKNTDLKKDIIFLSSIQKKS